MTRIDTSKKAPIIINFEKSLAEDIVAQEEAISAISESIQTAIGGILSPPLPLGVLLFVGPTGIGKTSIIEKAVHKLHRQKVIKYNCAEMTEAHEVSKIKGTTPGYRGFQDTKLLLDPKNIERHQTEEHPYTFLLFDEVDRGHRALWNLLLGIMEGSLILEASTEVDFSRCILFMTSNIGSEQLSGLMNSIGMVPHRYNKLGSKNSIERSLRRRMGNAFVNRIDKIVAFHPLNDDHLQQVVIIELQSLQQRIFLGKTKFTFDFDLKTVPEFIFKKGNDPKFGARPIRRAVKQYVTNVFSNAIATQQIKSGDHVRIGYDGKNDQLVFDCDPDGAVIDLTPYFEADKKAKMDAEETGKKKRRPRKKKQLTLVTTPIKQVVDRKKKPSKKPSKKKASRAKKNIRGR